MNRRRNQARTPILIFVAVILGSGISAWFGARYVYFKNRQIIVNREIDAADRRTEKCRLDIRTTQMRMDELVSYFVIARKIKENQSLLRPIPSGVVEEVDSTLSTDHSVASASP
jgi:hypothetical protein